MSVQFMQLNRNKDITQFLRKDTLRPYTIEPIEDTKTVTHHITGNINPEGVGANQPRVVALEGDKLTLFIRNANSPDMIVNYFSRMSATPR